MIRWLLLAVLTIGVTVPLTMLGVPAAALFAALVVAVALALLSIAPRRVPPPAGLAAQGVLGVYIGAMVRPDALSALGSDWPIVVAVAVGTLMVSIVAGALLGLRRDVSALTGALSLVAGGASGLVAIARELGGDDRVVAVVQYLRVALITSSMPVVIALIFHADRHGGSSAGSESGSLPWYLGVPLLAAIVVAGALAGRLARLPGSGLLGPMALTIVLKLTGLSFGLAVPGILVHAAYMLIGWQAGVAFTREAMRAIERILPAALLLIVALNVAAAGLGVVLAGVAGVSLLDGYLATSPGGIYAVLATAVDTGANVTFVVAAQVIRVLLMLFTAPLVAHAFGWVGRRRAAAQAHPAQDPASSSASRTPIRVAD